MTSWLKIAEYLYSVNRTGACGPLFFRDDYRHYPPPNCNCSADFVQKPRYQGFRKSNSSSVAKILYSPERLRILHSPCSVFRGQSNTCSICHRRINDIVRVNLLRHHSSHQPSHRRRQSEDFQCPSQNECMANCCHVVAESRLPVCLI